MGYNEAFREIVLDPFRENEGVNKELNFYLTKYREFKEQQPLDDQQYWSFERFIREKILRKAQTPCKTRCLSLLYTYCYMPCHVDANKVVIESEHECFFDPYIYRKPSNVLMIDVGCGPMTACLALADYQQTEKPDERLRLDYIGFDSEPHMTDIALEFGRRKYQNDLFGSNFRWCYPDGKNTLWVEQVRNPIKQAGTLVFYFSYFWGQEGAVKDIDRWVNRVKKISA